MEEKKVYLDSNVLIYSATSTDSRGKKCIEIIRKLVSGELLGFTSVLTFDEVFWKIKKISTKENALKSVDLFLATPNLIFLGADISTITRARDLIEDYDLDPRDSIHAATCAENNIETIISEDPDFDKMKGLKRKWI